MTRGVGGGRLFGRLAGVVVGLACLITFAGPGVQADAARPLRIVATTTQVADLARNVAGTAAHVERHPGGQCRPS